MSKMIQSLKTTIVGLAHGNLTATSRKQHIKNERQNDKKRPQ